MSTLIKYEAACRALAACKAVDEVKNLLDKDPPFAVSYDSNFGSGSSWEPRVADPRGRSFVLNLEYKFF